VFDSTFRLFGTPLLFDPALCGNPFLLDEHRQPNGRRFGRSGRDTVFLVRGDKNMRSEEHTSELQSHGDYLVCRLLLEKKKKSM
jgi:hypothetical protein